jgi:hypothetical protein
VESVALLIAVEGSQQVQDTLFKKLWRGFAPSFSAHVRLGERGAPVQFPTDWFLDLGFGVECCGIPHLAKNERDVGHPGLLVSEKSYRSVKDLTGSRIKAVMAK